MEPLKHYVVSWTIDVFADNPKEAAEIALEIQQDPESEALFFDVHEYTETLVIDLLDQD